eukprot:7378548-Prymnesium_polylepis.1
MALWTSSCEIERSGRGRKRIPMTQPRSDPWFRARGPLHNLAVRARSRQGLPELYPPRQPTLHDSPKADLRPLPHEGRKPRGAHVVLRDLTGVIL